MEIIDSFEQLAQALTLSFIMGCDEEESQRINKSISTNFKVKDKFWHVTKIGINDLENYLRDTPFTVNDDSHFLDVVKYKFNCSRGDYKKEERAVLASLKFLITKK